MFFSLEELNEVRLTQSEKSLPVLKVTGHVGDKDIDLDISVNRDVIPTIHVRTNKQTYHRPIKFLRYDPNEYIKDWEGLLTTFQLRGVSLEDQKRIVKWAMMKI